MGLPFLTAATAGSRVACAVRRAGCCGAGPVLPNRPPAGQPVDRGRDEPRPPSGRWVPSPIHRVSELAGGVKLDLRDAELLPGLTEIRLNVLMGGVSVIVSPDLDLEVDGWVFLGGIDKLAIHPAPLETKVRRVRIRARILMGHLDVTVGERTHVRADAS